MWIQDLSEELITRVAAIRLVVFDFDGVFTDNGVYVFDDGKEAVRCWRGDGLGLRKLERLGIETFIISTETNLVVSLRAEKIRIPCIQGVENKRDTLVSIIREKDLNYSQVAYLGNDINDLDCLAIVGLPIAVQDAHPDILPLVQYRTNARGGHGAVREFCDLVERIHGR